jgi:tetratricopeptide (TPR) repeat protein
LGNPALRLLVLFVAAVVVTGLVLVGIFGLGRARPVALAPTDTPGPRPTFTLTPTYIGERAAPATATPKPSGLVPLWTLLEATYTPTPVYINTPHAVSEAYRSGQRAFTRGDLPAALQFFKQAVQVDPDSPDLHYYVGEIQSLLKNPEAALAAYEAALSANPSFAPAYFGRARARLALQPSSAADSEAIEADFSTALEIDPNFGEIYLARAAYWLSRGQDEAAQEDLQAAELLLPASPLLPLYQAQLLLNAGDATGALSLARQAKGLDLTLLEAYRTLGQAALEAGEFAESAKALQTYLLYRPEDFDAWLAAGRAQAGLSGPEAASLDLVAGDQSQAIAAALESFDQALKLSEESSEVHFYRSLALLQAGQGQLAVNGLLLARKLEGERPGGGQAGALWFPIHLGLGRALETAGRHAEADSLLKQALELAESDEQHAAVYFWRAPVREALEDRPAAYADWQALVKLPEKSYPASWGKIAIERISALATPTPTATATPTSTSTVTPRPSATVKPTATPTLTRTPRPSATPRVTSTPKITATAKTTMLTSPTPTPRLLRTAAP